MKQFIHPEVALKLLYLGMPDLTAEELAEQEKDRIAAALAKATETRAAKIKRWAGWLLVQIALLTIYAFLLAFVLAILYHVAVGIWTLWQQGQQRIAEACLVTVSAVVMQVVFLMRVSPAFRPVFVRERMAQRYFPIRQVDIVRRWFAKSRIHTQVTFAALLLIASFALVSHADALVVITNFLWQCVVLVCATQFSYLVVSRCGRIGWVGTIAFWTYSGMSLFSLHGFMLLGEIEFAGLIAGPFLLVLYVPTWLTMLVGPWGSLAAVSSCFGTMVWMAYQSGRLFSPSRSRLAKVCRSWRNLPDRDEPKLGMMSYPKKTANADSADSSHKIGMRPDPARLIRRHIKCPSPKSLTDPQTWWRVRVFGLGFLFLYAAISTTVVMLNVIAKIPTSMLFATASVVCHLPAIFGLVKAIPLLRSRAVTAKGLLRIGGCGLLTDTLIAATVLLPFALVIGHALGDFTAPISHLATCLLVAAGIRMAAVVALRYHTEYYSIAVAWYVLFLATLGCFALAAVLDKIFGVAMPVQGYFVPIQLAFAVLVFGSDRLAARIHPHTPAIRATWNWVMHTPIRLPILNRYAVRANEKNGRSSPQKIIRS